MESESKRTLVERVLQRAEQRGHKVDPDPVFRELIEEWIHGTLEMDEVRRRYQDLRLMRAAEKRQGKLPPKPISTDALQFDYDTLLSEISDKG